MKVKIRIAAVLIIALSTIINAQNFNDALRLSDPGLISSPRAFGMGNAYTSISNDFSASLFNPAGFGLIKKTEFSGSFGYNSFNSTTTFFNNKTDFSNSLTNLNQIGFAFPLPTSQGSFVLGFGYNEFKNFNSAIKFDGYNPSNNSMIQDLTSYNDNIAYNLALSYGLYDNNNNYLKDTTVIAGGLNQSGNILQDGGLKSWSFSGAVEFQKDFFLGVTFGWISGNFNRDRQYYETDVNNNYPASILLDPAYPETADFQSFYFNDVIKWDLSAWDVTFGLLTKLNDNLNFGFTFKLPRSYTIKETYFVDANSQFGTGQSYTLDPPIDNKVEYKISTPYEITAGVSYNHDDFTISYDAKLIDYTQMKFDSGLDEGTISSNNRDIKDLFRTTINMNAGVEYNISSLGLSLRGGFMYRPSPFKGDPSEYDKKFVTGGLGISTSNNIQFNIAYGYGWWKDFGDNYGVNESKTYQDISHSNLMVGIKYYF